MNKLVVTKKRTRTKTGKQDETREKRLEKNKNLLCYQNEIVGDRRIGEHASIAGNQGKRVPAAFVARWVPLTLSSKKGNEEAEGRYQQRDLTV
jgi:hypothetical protein